MEYRNFDGVNEKVTINGQKISGINVVDTELLRLENIVKDDLPSYAEFKRWLYQNVHGGILEFARMFDLNYDRKHDAIMDYYYTNQFAIFIQFPCRHKPGLRDVLHRQWGAYCRAYRENIQLNKRKDIKTPKDWVKAKEENMPTDNCPRCGHKEEEVKKPETKMEKAVDILGEIHLRFSASDGLQIISAKDPLTPEKLEALVFISDYIRKAK